MSTILVGALLIIVGLVLMAGPPIWRGRLSGGRSAAAPQAPTLEPRQPAAGFGLKANLPGLAVMALGVLVMLAGTFL
jgi:hypothetical protein